MYVLHTFTCMCAHVCACGSACMIQWSCDITCIYQYRKDVHKYKTSENKSASKKNERVGVKGKINRDTK